MAKQKDKEELMKKVQTEYTIFKYKMLSDGRKEIYDACAKIFYYECMHEYFEYNEEIPEKFVDAMADTENIMERLYVLYLKNEHLQVDTWKAIEELLEAYIGSVS